MVRRGEVLRRRRQAVASVGLAVMVQLAVALPLLARADDDDEPTRLDVAAETGTTPSTRVPEVAGVTFVAPPPVPPPPPTTAPPTTAARAAAPTTTAPACRNSTSPRCGPFRWDPAPGPNQAATATITSSPAAPRAGQPMTFVLRMVDPDAPGVRLWSGPCVQPDPGGPCDRTPASTDCQPYGPWAPPPRQALDRTERYTITFNEPGTYRVTFTAISQSNPCTKLDPYGSIGTTTVEVVISP